MTSPISWELEILTVVLVSISMTSAGWGRSSSTRKCAAEQAWTGVSSGQKMILGGSEYLVTGSVGFRSRNEKSSVDKSVPVQHISSIYVPFFLHLLGK